MKNILLLFLLVVSHIGFASPSKKPKTPQKEFIISITNGMSQLFYAGPSYSVSTSPTKFLSGLTSVKYIPAYTTHVQLLYSRGIRPWLRIDFGLGYQISSYIVQTEASYSTPQPYHIKEDVYSLTGNITVPLYLVYIKPVGKGAITLTFGPDFTLPVNEFTKANYYYNGVQASNLSGKDRMRYHADETAGLSSMGIYLKAGYKKELKGGTVIDVGPAFNFYELVNFHNQDFSNPATPIVSKGITPYQYYVGVDVAFVFEFETGGFSSWQRRNSQKWFNTVDAYSDTIAPSVYEFFISKRTGIFSQIKNSLFDVRVKWLIYFL
jgi:hypothetical protein